MIFRRPWRPSGEAGRPAWSATGPRRPAPGGATLIRLALMTGLALLTAVPPAVADTGLPLAVPPIAYAERTLDNGLRVYAVRAATPNVAVQLWYRVGGRDDPAGRSGFAHLFEHLMFKSTANMPAEMLDRLTEDVGGANNASTWADRTAYTDIVPGNHLERVLWAEADRLKALVVDAANFASERDVVKEEFREAVLADPYGRLDYRLLPQLAFATDPHRRGVVGDLADLDAARIEDVRDFHATYYRPDNAVLVVAGDFDPADLDRWVDRYFGALPRPERPLPRRLEPEPLPAVPRRVDAYAPNVPLPVVLTLQRLPAAAHADMPALRVLDAVLVGGKASRLYRALVGERRLGSDIFAAFESFADAGYAAYGVVAAEGASLDAAEAVLAAELARLRDEPVTAAELAEAKIELLAAAARRRETVEGLSAELAEAALIDGDAASADRSLAAIGAVSAAAVQAAARRYLGEASATAVRYLSEDLRPADAPALDLTATPASSAEPLPPIDAPVSALRAEADRERPPPAGPVRPLALPAARETRLSNGLRVIVAPSGAQPLATARLVVGSGSCFDRPGLGGAAALLAATLTEGAGARSAAELAAAAEGLGALLGAGAGPDTVTVQVSAPDASLAAATALLADIVRRPRLAPADFERERARAVDAYRATLAEPAAAASLAIPALLFGGGPCGQPDAGSASTLQAVAHADIVASHGQAFRPDNAMLVLTGRVSSEQGLFLAETLFGDWPRPEAPPPRRDPLRIRDGTRRIVTVEIEGGGQTAVLAALRLPALSGQERVAAELANSVLGGGFSARLARTIRIERGLAYSADSAIEFGADSARVTAVSQTRDATAATVARLILAEFGRLSEAPIPPAELDARKAALIGQFGAGLETSTGLAASLAGFALSPGGIEAFYGYADAVRALDAEAVQAAARRWFPPRATDLILVGGGDGLPPAPGAVGEPVERIPADRFDPALPTLLAPEPPPR